MNRIAEEAQELKNLIVYEIATKNFTSPAGAQSGTFASLEERLDYLKDLGINAVWMSGHQWCDGKHFYNIWTEYACIRPDRLDPGLGTEEEFAHMVEEAHRHGIKIFLDVITHGVMEESPLVKEHPDWFRKGTWGMADFDWYGDHKELDQWWINTWMYYIERFGIDGYRLDVAHYRNDLWAVIRKKAKDLGKEIVIIAENGPAIRGVTDIIQHGDKVRQHTGEESASRMLWDMAGYCRDRQLRLSEKYEVRIQYTDGTIQDSIQYQSSETSRVLEVIQEPPVSEVTECAEGTVSYVMQKGILRVENIFGEKEIYNIQIRNREEHIWNSRLEETLEVDYWIKWKKKCNGIYLEFPLRIQDHQCLSIQLSCHDNGWDGHPLGENPYAARGSRYLAGYAALLAPAVPVFMTGEEFDADYRPLPDLSPRLYGKEKIGEGRWLYGSWIDWEQLKLPAKKEMLEDVRRIIEIRKMYPHLITPARMGDRSQNCFPVEYWGADELPIPYLYKSEKEALVVAANPAKDRDAVFCMKLSEHLEKGKKYRVNALFGTLPFAENRLKNAAKLDGQEWRIGKDKSRQGGLLVLHFREE